MFKHTISFIILAVISLSLSAQTLKTGAVIIGNTPGSVAASIQSARSGAETTLITQTPAIDPDFTTEDLEYLGKIQNHYKLKSRKKNAPADTLFDVNITKDQYTRLIKGITDTTKNLKVIVNSGVAKIEKDGKGWEIRLKNGQKIKATVIVDATENLSIASMLRIDANKTLMPLTNAPLFESKLYRSTVAISYTGTDDARSVAPMSLGEFIPAGVENFIIVPKATANVKPVKMSVGQAAGTIAAYCAFFKTTTKSINVRIVQGELLAFDSQLIPFSDITTKDPNFMAFQRMAVSGLLKPSLVKVNNHTEIKFDTLGTISTQQLRAPMREFYSASQIWFLDNTSDKMTVEQVISLLKVTARRGNELTAEIEEGWNKSFKLNGKFDLKKVITRKEFAILAEKYLTPFNVRVDFAGNLLS